MSSPGLVYVYAQDKELLSALLFNFDIGSPVVKPEHRDWLKGNTSRYFARGMKATIIGLASRTGSDSLNMNLSSHRALNVDNIFRALAPISARPVMDLRIALGEEAAAIAGIEDGVEDQRWRAVFLSVWDPHKMTITEVLANRYFGTMLIKRRTHVQLIVGQETGKYLPKEPGDGWNQVGLQVASALGISGSQIVQEKTARFHEGDTVLKVTIKRSNTSGGGLYTVKYLDVDYDWGPVSKLNGGNRALVIKPSDEDLKLDRSLRDEVTDLTVEQMNRWLQEPYQAWYDLRRL